MCHWTYHKTGGKLLVVKYYAPWCRSCLNVKPQFEKVAERPSSQEAAEFVECDAGASRALFCLADIKRMPCVHVYRDGTLVDTRMINNKPLFETFEERFALHAKGYDA